MMSGESLHEFDLQLTNYILMNVRQHLGKRGFAQALKRELRGQLFEYIAARTDLDDEDIWLLLHDEECDELVSAFDSRDPARERRWEPYAQLHARYVDTVKEVRDALSRQVADDWSRACVRFGAALQAEGLSVAEGLQIVSDWANEARRLLKAMGRTELLPRPEDSYPTPTSVEPPPSKPAALAPLLEEPKKDDNLRAMLAETQDMQKEVRDLLLSQKTVKDYYTTADVAAMLGKAEFTVRAWCRNGRVRANKQGSGRGKHQAWVIAHEELLRFQREGLLSADQPGWHRYDHVSRPIGESMSAQCDSNTATKMLPKPRKQDSGAETARAVSS